MISISNLIKNIDILIKNICFWYKPPYESRQIKITYESFYWIQVYLLPPGAPWYGCSIAELWIIASTDYMKGVYAWSIRITNLPLMIFYTRATSFSIHHRSLQRFAMEMYKAYNDLSPSLVKSIFPKREIPYNFRNCNPFKFTNGHTVFKGTETISFRGPKIWSLVPANIKHAKSLSEFKTKIETGNLLVAHAGHAKHSYLT